MDSVYVLLLVLAGTSLLLKIDWLMLASIFLFFALIFSKYYSEFSAPRHVPQEILHPEGTGQGGPSAPQPIIVVSSGGGTAATISDSVIATMMGNFMAMDAYEQRDQAPQTKFLSRGMKMRQNMFDHAGKVGSYHQGLKHDYTEQMLKKLDSIDKKLSK
ncbi:MAG: hypothetical protein ABH863_06075 [Candidatus Micrarchaeota archaeon]